MCCKIKGSGFSTVRMGITAISSGNGALVMKVLPWHNCEQCSRECRSSWESSVSECWDNTCASEGHTGVWPHAVAS